MLIFSRFRRYINLLFYLFTYLKQNIYFLAKFILSQFWFHHLCAINAAVYFIAASIYFTVHETAPLGTLATIKCYILLTYALSLKVKLRLDTCYIDQVKSH